MKKWIPVLFPLLVAACSSADHSYTEEFQLQLEEIQTIQSGEDTGDTVPVLPFIDTVASNSRGDIYIFTGQEATFHVYDKEGEWIRSFGGSGSGPGEFGQISAIYIDREDRLMVADREHNRISVFDDRGNLLDTKPVSAVQTVRSIRELPDGRFLISGNGTDGLVHIFDRQLQRKENSFGNIEDFATYDQQYERNWMTLRAGHAFALSNEKIAFTPDNYRGKIYLYEHDESGKWGFSGQIEGYREIEPALSFYPDRPPSNTPVHAMFGAAGSMASVSYHSLSYGFYRFDDESLFHISYLTGDEQMKLVVERFDLSSETLTEYGISGELEIEHSFRKRPLWMDPELNIYLTDNRDIPQLRVLALRFQQL